jgi:hypothetical protein
MSFGNKEEEVCHPIQKKTSSRLLKNQEETNITSSEKTLQIISQNETHTSIVMPCNSSVVALVLQQKSTQISRVIYRFKIINWNKILFGDM